MARIFLTHVPDMLENYYGPRALAEMRKLGEVRVNTTGKVLDAQALDRKSTRLNSSHRSLSRMPSSA